jgi:phospholipid/cholesterol/gamma-HCH transport system ATP-binding protein
MSIIQVENVAQSFDGRTIFKDVTFDVAPGEVFVILGGSGCGKSTLLKQMVGLLVPDVGTVRIGGRDVRTEIEVIRREAVFTDLPASARQEIARIKLALVGLADAAFRLPAEISGGMVKRAAIARALALDPPVLLLDEPSAGLDPVTSAGLDRLILDLRDRLGSTFVVVTHELASILAIADRCVMLDAQAQGMIALGDPHELAQNSTVPMVRAFFHREAM